MEALKIVTSVAVLIATSTKREVKKHEGKSITQPDMALGIAEILRKSQIGMEVKGFNPVFYSGKNKALVGFENMSKIDQIEFARKFKAYAADQVKALKDKANQDAKDKKDAEFKAAVEAEVTKLSNPPKKEL